LTLKNPWPLAGDNSGRVPMFYLADGSVHVRLTDSGGVVQFDYPSMLVIGPSTGGGGGGGSVDPTTIFQTGDVMWLDVDGTRAGWVRDNGRTLGNAVSGASERANADTQALFVFLWNTYVDTVCSVVGGRGANGLADFTAGKQITLPDKRAMCMVGNTAMGSADGAALAGVPFYVGNSTTAGSRLGEATHTLSTPETPVHTHAFTGDLMPTHSHPLPYHGVVSYSGSGGSTSPISGGGDSTTSVSAGTPTGTNSNTGGGGAHNNTQFGVIGTFYRKL
jgi:microcystin-dependent protein